MRGERGGDAVVFGLQLSEERQSRQLLCTAL